MKLTHTLVGLVGLVFILGYSTIASAIETDLEVRAGVSIHNKFTCHELDTIKGYEPTTLLVSGLESGWVVQLNNFNVHEKTTGFDHGTIAPITITDAQNNTEQRIVLTPSIYDDGARVDVDAFTFEVTIVPPVSATLGLHRIVVSVDMNGVTFESNYNVTVHKAPKCTLSVPNNTMDLGKLAMRNVESTPASQIIHGAANGVFQIETQCITGYHLTFKPGTADGKFAGTQNGTLAYLLTSMVNGYVPLDMSSGSATLDRPATSGVEIDPLIVQIYRGSGKATTGASTADVTITLTPD